uniref:Uncharacterized protein n=1 Tax=Magallana gigas TaxID=29159 RepID=K1PYB3_MAGGI
MGKHQFLTISLFGAECCHWEQEWFRCYFSVQGCTLTTDYVLHSAGYTESTRAYDCTDCFRRDICFIGCELYKNKIQQSCSREIPGHDDILQWNITHDQTSERNDEAASSIDFRGIRKLGIWGNGRFVRDKWFRGRQSWVPRRGERIRPLRL